MKNTVLLLALCATISGCKQSSRGDDSLTVEWKVVSRAVAGIVDGEIVYERVMDKDDLQGEKRVLREGLYCYQLSDVRQR